MKFQDFETLYIDAFAGTGEVPLAANYDGLPLDDEGLRFLSGSVRRALAIDESFGQYIFIEKKRSNAKALESLTTEFPAKTIRVVRADANQGLRTICGLQDWRKSRAVVFLDPFGSQVEWSTLELLAQTGSIDLWYLFPAGLCVNRQVQNKDGQVRAEHQAALDRMLGTRNWRTAFAEEILSEPDLFMNPIQQTRKAVTTVSATLFMIDRLRLLFRGGVLDEYLALGTGGVHMFSLLFAWANPSPKARKAGDIARSVMRSKQRGRAK